MTEYGCSGILSQAGNNASHAQKQASPWDKFLVTLDTNPKMTPSEVMELFGKTLSHATSDWKDSNDNTLLMHMASRGQTAVAKRLIREFYVPVNATNKDGMTALHMAARGGFKDTCDMLLTSHADPCKKDRNGSTPAMIAKDQGHTGIADSLSKQETAKRLWSATAGFGR